MDWDFLYHLSCHVSRPLRHSIAPWVLSGTLMNVASSYQSLIRFPSNNQIGHQVLVSTVGYRCINNDAHLTELLRFP